MIMAMDLSKEYSSKKTATNGLAGWIGSTFFGAPDVTQENMAYEAYLNDELANNQFERDVQFWQMNNEYNSPAAQMLRAREAGLNPSLLYGQPISESSPVSGGAPSVGLGSSRGNISPSNIMDLGRMPAEIDLMRAQAEEIRSRIPLNQQKINESRARVDDLIASVDQRKVSAQSMLANSKLSDAMRENISFEQNMKNQYLTMDYEKLGLFRDKTNAEISKMKAEERDILARAKVSERELYEMINTYAIRRAGLEKQNLLTDAQIRQAEATADKLRKDGVRVEQLIDMDMPAQDRATSMFNAANSSNPFESFGGQLMYAIDYAADNILGSLLK